MQQRRRTFSPLRGLVVLVALTALAASTAAQSPSTWTLGGATVRLAAGGGTATATLSRDGGRTFAALPPIDDRLHLRAGVFDPLTARPAYAAALAAPADGHLFAVQCRTSILPEYRQALLAAGLEVVGYWPMNAYLVRGDRAVATALRTEPWVRWVGDVAIAEKLDGDLIPVVAGADVIAPDRGEFNLVLTRKSDRGKLIAELGAIGGEVSKRNDGSVYLQALLTPKQLAAAAALDTVLWIDRTTALENDMDNARIQGGGNYVEQMGGYTGRGVRAEISEGLDQTHHDWTNPPLIRYDGLENHGHCTSMIVGGNGSGMPTARGMMPDCQIIESSYVTWSPTVSRYALIQGSVQAPWRAMQQTASWGSTTTTQYTSISQEMDNALFDFDFVLTQSQSNTGTQSSRPQAWAKNVISVGGVRHLNNSNPADDTWTTASIGPASDGRIKPEICAYYESVLCGDRPGAAGYTTTDYYTAFSGTSSATPIVNGHVGLIQQMFTDGLFGNPLPQPATDAFRFDNKPHMTTAKALLTNSAASYPFSGTTANLTRVHQGWGFPDLRRLYDNRQKIVVVDEYDVLTQGQERTYYVWIRPGTADFRATMVYADPEALPSALIHRINSVDLKVVRFSDGTTWYGNNGLDSGNVSFSGGFPNDRDTCEQVWLSAPQPGLYTITVSAPTIVQDAHVETPALDVDYALVAHPVGGGYQTQGAMTIDLVSASPGDFTVQVASVPASGWTEGFTFFSLTATGRRGFGNFFGIERDFVVDLALGEPALPDSLFHFTNNGPASYPFVPVTLPPAIGSLLSGIAVDGIVTLLDASGQIVEQSTIDRVTVQ